MLYSITLKFCAKIFIIAVSSNSITQQPCIFLDSSSFDPFLYPLISVKKIFSVGISHIFGDDRTSLLIEHKVNYFTEAHMFCP